MIHDYAKLKSGSHHDVNILGFEEVFNDIIYSASPDG